MISYYGTAERKVIISLAGGAAQRLAKLPDSGGWVRIRTEDEVNAIHEAGHVVAAYVLGWHVSEVVLDVSEEEMLVVETGAPVLAFARIGPSPGAEERDGEPQTDLRQAATVCFAMAGTWKGALDRMRVLRAATESLIVEHWAAVRILASEIMLDRVLKWERIATVLGRETVTSDQRDESNSPRPPARS